jgi:hypothetical protein
VKRPEVPTRVPTRNGSGPPPAASQRPDDGITVEELAERVVRPVGTIAPDELERWLRDAGFAELHGGLLSPTARAIEVAGGLG